MSRHLTYRFWLCGLLGLGGIALTLITRRLEPVALGSPFLVTLLLSLVDGWWRPVGVEAPRISAARVIEGDELRLELDLVAEGPVPWVELEVQFPANLEPTGPARFVTRLRPTSRGGPCRASFRPADAGRPVGTRPGRNGPWSPAATGSASRSGWPATPCRCRCGSIRQPSNSTASSPCTGSGP